MNKFIYTIIVLLFTSFIFSQDYIISGIIKDSLKRPIQYVNVGLSNRPIGTVTNEKGEFILNLDEKSTLDTLKLSCLGYKGKSLAIKNIKNIGSQLEILLEHFTEKLEEVVISSKKLKIYTEGSDNTSTKVSCNFSDQKLVNGNLGTEIGRKFNLKTKNPSLMTNFKFYLNANNFSKLKFRINFYTISQGLPDKKINRENIFATVNNKQIGWINIDLNEYDIKSQEDLIITVEWIESSKDGTILSIPIIIPSLGSTHYYKFGSQASFKKFRMLSTSMLLTYKQ